MDKSFFQSPTPSIENAILDVISFSVTLFIFVRDNIPLFYFHDTVQSFM
jgi:hypothetical protein